MNEYQNVEDTLIQMSFFLPMQNPASKEATAMTIDLKEAFAKNLTYYLSKSGLSQKELAEMVGVSGATLSLWINGKKYARIDKIEKLANIFQITKSDLIEMRDASETAPIALTQDETELIRAFRETGNSHMIPVITSLVRQCNKNAK